MPNTLKVLFVAAEADPFIKVGGLGDVAGSLPRALHALTHDFTGGIDVDVRLVLPLHTMVRTESATLRPTVTFRLTRIGSKELVQIFETSLDGVPVYFVAGDPINRNGAVYSSNAALDGEKYTFFSLAVLEMLPHLGWQPDILHANDWHTALTVYALWMRRQKNEFPGTCSVLTVHNLPFMGPDLASRLAAYGLPLVTSGLPKWARAMPLPLGLWSADAIVGVSPTYAREILTPEYGAGLEDFLQTRSDVLHGILNGIDTKLFDPATDETLAFNFKTENVSMRMLNKKDLQVRMDLKKDPSIPLLAMVSRMDPQKGVDLALDALRLLGDLPWQVIILGTGDPVLESQARLLQADFSEQVRVETRYDATLARQIYGGADILLMPSRYEPCGLAQMIAMRYGCLPLVRATGGLKDTVIPDQTGFVFDDNTAEALAAAIRKALALYPDRKRWQAMQKTAMSQDFSWERSARRYFNLYQSLLSHRL
ncbi:MAG: glycogen synthase [Candidatus Villigracilaceae bacterium]